MGLKDKFKGRKKSTRTTVDMFRLDLDEQFYIKTDTSYDTFMLVERRERLPIEEARKQAEHFGRSFNEEEYDEEATRDVVLGYHGRLTAAIYSWTQKRTAKAVAHGALQVVEELKAQTAILQRIHDAEEEWWFEVPKTKEVKVKVAEGHVAKKTVPAPRRKSVVDHDEKNLDKMTKDSA